jgi:hypothetical protein
MATRLPCGDGARVDADLLRQLALGKSKVTTSIPELT